MLEIWHVSDRDDADCCSMWSGSGVRPWSVMAARHRWSNVAIDSTTISSSAWLNDDTCSWGAANGTCHQSMTTGATYALPRQTLSRPMSCLAIQASTMWTSMAQEFFTATEWQLCRSVMPLLIWFSLTLGIQVHFEALDGLDAFDICTLLKILCFLYIKRLHLMFWHY